MTAEPVATYKDFPIHVDQASLKYVVIFPDPGERTGERRGLYDTGQKAREAIDRHLATASSVKAAALDVLVPRGYRQERGVRTITGINRQTGYFNGVGDNGRQPVYANVPWIAGVLARIDELRDAATRLETVIERYRIPAPGKGSSLGYVGRVDSDKDYSERIERLTKRHAEVTADAMRPEAHEEALEAADVEDEA